MSILATLNRSVAVRLIACLSTVLPLGCNRSQHDADVSQQRFEESAESTTPKESAEIHRSEIQQHDQKVVLNRNSKKQVLACFRPRREISPFIINGLASLAEDGLFSVAGGDIEEQDDSTRSDLLEEASIVAIEIARDHATSEIRKWIKSKRILERLRDASALKNTGSRILTTRAIRASAKLWLVGMAVNYAAAFGGIQDFKEANRVAIASTTGIVAGVGFVTATTTIVGAFAAASTGTAISTLSGAAASGAILAWLGGGTIAAGGFGMAGGAVVLTGGAILVVFAVSGAVMYGFDQWDDASHNELTRRRLEWLESRYTQ